ncbi:MAG: hypothetical protein DMG88_20660 [Acidobacteria bacterium]|nr:MAG: hypothetical protein DMG88_20660 [Acidobacteriota bacterium]
MKPFDADGVFRITANAVPQLAIRGAGVTIFSATMGLCIQIISTVTLARLLTPADFGLVAMVTTFSLLFMNFGLNGFTEAILQREQIDHFLASNLFWINTGIGFILTIGFSLGGAALARFYGEPQVAHIAIAMSATIFVNSVSVVHFALLKRAMHFPAVAASEILARTVSVAVSIVLAWAGWAYWALVAGSIVLPLTLSIAAWARCRWIPSLPRSVDGTSSVLRFALNTYGRFSFDYFARNTDNLLVGWRFGAHALGFYKKAYDLFALPAGQSVSPLTSVAVSALSRFRRDPVQYRRHLLNALTVIAFVGLAISADLTLVGKDLIRLLLGPRWEEAGRIFTFFAPGIGIMLIYYTNGWIHLSLGMPNRWLRWGFVEAAVTLLLFGVALPWGPVGIAIAWSASFWILTLPALWYAGRPIQLGIGPILASVWKYALAALLAGYGSGFILQIHSPAAVSGPGETFVRIGTVSLLFLALYIAVVVSLYRGCEPLYRVGRLLPAMVSWVRFRASHSPTTQVIATPNTRHKGSFPEPVSPTCLSEGMD